MWYLYILLCDDKTLYTGITNDLNKRFNDHETGNGAKYTKSHKPKEIIYTEEFYTRSRALKREAEIKKLSRLEKLKLCEERNNSSCSGKGH